jgi:predicted dehydrogenase
VATPPGDHAAAALRLLAAGTTVLVEKPLCTTAADADALVAATAVGGRLVYAENLAFAPAVEAFLAACRRAGPLHHLEARALQARPGWGEFLTEGWGGGALFDLGAHPIALVLLAAGPARPVAVQGVLRGGPTTDEHGTARIRFDDGLVATVVASWLDGPAPLWDVEAAGSGAVTRLELLPATSLELDGRPVALAPSTSAPAIVEELGYLGQLRHAVAVAAGAEPRIDAVFGRAVLEVTLGAYASAGRGGAWVPLPWAGPRDRTPLELWRA